MTKLGYLRWRTDLKNFSRAQDGRNPGKAGCPASVIKAVQDLNLKKNFPADSESRILEDALCLVFLEFQLADLAARTPKTR